MGIHSGYFEIKNPLLILEQWLHPYRHQNEVDYRGKILHVNWTNRAHRQLQERKQPLIVEMQIYFSCVVQKRVLFHEQLAHDTIDVNNYLSIVLRPVQAKSCDPEEFAKNHPVEKEYESQAARQFQPTLLNIDYRKGEWSGEFFV